jgi:hypothetical protein
MSFMRGMIQNVVTSMSPQERQEAIRDVTALVAAKMTPAERAETMSDVIKVLIEGLSVDERQALVRSIASGNSGS